MMSTLHLELAIKATLILLAAYAAAGALRKASAALRHVIWLTALVCLLLLPAASRTIPHWVPKLSVAAQPAASPTLTSITVYGNSQGLPIRRILLYVWLAGAGVLLLRSAAGHASVLALARRARALQYCGRVSRRISAEIDVPMICGLWHPVILLPSQASSWPEARLAVIFSHEEAHALRHDTLWQLISDIARALYWPLPWVWWAASRLRTESELACDDTVLLAGEKASDYAGHLIDIVRGLTGREHIPQGAIAMARRSDLELRLRAMLSAQRRRGPVGRKLIVCTGIAALCLLIPLAATRVSANPAEPGIGGVVMDASGARVPGARILLIFKGQDRKEVATSNATGEFSFSPLPDGEYWLQVAKPGFALMELKGIVLDGGKSAPLNIVLQSGKVHETLTVTAEEPGGPVLRSAPNGTPQRIRVGGNVQSTKLEYKVNPVYPVDCKTEGIQGTVMLRALISPQGTVTNLQAINQLVDPRLVAAAIDAVKQWRYEPTLLNGEPIAVSTDIDVNFVLK